MVTTAHISSDNALTHLQDRAGRNVTKAIQKASRKTGVDFSYLMHQAAAESNFDIDAQAKTSSARGLYQFIEKTWLSMVKKHGAKYGLDHYAGEIGSDLTVKDGALKDKILALRDDPEISAYLAAEFADENAAYLERHLDEDYGTIGATEMYFAHFLGASGASGFLNAYKTDPLATAADLFPKAARANRNVFYDRKTGEARTLAGVYEFFDKKFRNDTPQNASPDPQRQPAAVMAKASHPVNDPRFARISRENKIQFMTEALGLHAKPDMFTASLRGINKADSGYSRASFFTGLVKNPVTLMMLADTGYLDTYNENAEKAARKRKSART